MFCKKRDDQLMGTKCETFELQMEADWVSSGDILLTLEGHQIEVITPFVPVVNNQWDKIKVWLNQFRLVRWVKKCYLVNLLIGLEYKANVKLVKQI